MNSTEDISRIGWKLSDEKANWAQIEVILFVGMCLSTKAPAIWEESRNKFLLCIVQWLFNSDCCLEHFFLPHKRERCCCCWLEETTKSARKKSENENDLNINKTKMRSPLFDSTRRELNVRERRSWEERRSEQHKSALDLCVVSPAICFHFRRFGRDRSHESLAFYLISLLRATCNDDGRLFRMSYVKTLIVESTALHHRFL